MESPVIEEHRRVLFDIAMERERQDTLKAEGRFEYTCADLAMSHPQHCLTILAEEFGEVARAICDNRENLRAELIQVAAVCLAWLEGLDS